MTEANENTLGQENGDALDKLHCFGSRWFCLQMQEAFDVQGAVLKEIAYKHQNPALKSVAPLIYGLNTAVEAISLLRRDNLLNEAHVLMRVLIERGINLCYILVSEDAAQPAQTSPQAQLDPKPKPAAEELIDFAKNYRFTETYDNEGLETKLNTLSKKTSIPPDFLRVIVSAHYPQASLALSGSLFGALVHLQNFSEEQEEHFSQNFAILLFAGNSLLNYIIQVMGAYGIPESLVKDSNASTEASNRLMLSIRERVETKVRNAYGWWQSLSDHEYFAAKRLAPFLREFETAFSACIEAGMEVPMIATQGKSSLRLRISALYLKRLLNDFRSVWLMVRQGNTSQAGSIAASLFEIALMIQCLAESDARATRLSKAPDESWPWDKRTMCRFVIEDEARREKKQANPKVTDALYARYSWLCEIKHATLEYVTHDSRSTHVKEKGYTIMPFPDVREEDWPVKKKILLISLLSTMEAIEAFARGGAVPSTETAFFEKVKTARDVIVKCLEEKG